MKSSSPISDPIIHRTSILYDVLQGKSIEDVYKGICNAYGNEAISFLEVDFWYFRFYNGERDLNYDRSQDPKPLRFSNLPDDDIQAVLNRLTDSDCLIIRKTCHRLQDLINSRPFISKSVIFNCSEKRAILKLDDHEISYQNSKNDVFLKNHNHKSYHNGIVFEDLNYISMALEDLKAIFKNPKNHLKKLKLNLFKEPETMEDNLKLLSNLEMFLKSLGHQLNLEEITLKWCKLENLLEILPYLKPGVLKSINIYFYNSDNDLEIIRKLSKLDQWKQAKKLGIWVKDNETSIFSLVECFLNFTHLEFFPRIELVETVGTIREIFEKFSNLEVLKLSAGFYFTPFCRRLLSPDITVTHDSGGVARGIYPVDGRVFNIESHTKAIKHLKITFTLDSE